MALSHRRPGYWKWLKGPQWQALGLLLASVLPVLALDPNNSVFQYNCQTWRRADGLPVNSVNAIAQTADGRLWLGTSRGLVYFNGVDFSIVTPTAADNAENMVVTALARRGTQGLWYGLAGGAFGFFDGKNFHGLQPLVLSGVAVTIHRIV